MTKRSFTAVILLLYGFIFVSIGIGLLCFTKEVILFTFIDTPAHVINVMHQLLGSAYLLIGLLMFVINNLKGTQTTIVPETKTVGIGSQILKELGLKKIKLLAAPVKYPSLGGFDLEIIGFEQ